MLTFQLTPQQESVANLPPNEKVFLEGLAGCGKTTAVVQYALEAIAQGVPADHLLVWVPQRTLASTYQAAFYGADFYAGPRPDILTLGGLARRSISLFWPTIARDAGFAKAGAPPTFLTLETAQFSLAQVVEPLLSKGFFDSITISRTRLLGQVLDNLNKAAVVGFPHTEIGIRLKEAWIGASSQARVYDDTQNCVNQFRGYCLEHNLLDYSLQVEVFRHCLWPQPQFQSYIRNRYQHLVADNLEEDVPIAHDLLKEWLPNLASGMLVVDSQAGYRRFLGADPEGAYRLKEICSKQFAFQQSFVTPPTLILFGCEIGKSLNRATTAQESREDLAPDAMFQDGVRVCTKRFHIEMVSWAVETTRQLVCEEGIEPKEIVILAPFLSDVLRFSLIQGLEKAGIPARSHRPSRGLHEEPAIQALFTLACIAHPSWGEIPKTEDVAYTLSQVISALDPVRACLLAKIVYSPKPGTFWLGSFDSIIGSMKERITLTLGKYYSQLRTWLWEYSQQGEELDLDHFFSRLFGEVLSQPHFGFHLRLDAAEATASLIESMRKFRWEMGSELKQQDLNPGLEYLRMVRSGVLAAQYLPKWRGQAEGAVLISPAHTFLMSNRVVSSQIWLDVGGHGWWERLYQPLTQPYVLTRNWRRGAKWTDDLDFDANQENLYRLSLGLLSRCRNKVYLGISELGEQGFEQKGPLLSVVERILRRAAMTMSEASHV